jgi:hypothetical protein
MTPERTEHGEGGPRGARRGRNRAGSRAARPAAQLRRSIRHSLGLTLALVVLAVSLDGCRRKSNLAPEGAVQVDATISPASAHIGDQVTVTIVANNNGDGVLSWIASCSLNLSFRIVDSTGTVVEAPEYGTCNSTSRVNALEPHSTLTQRVTYPLGSATAAGATLRAGNYTVFGQMSVRDSLKWSGHAATLTVLP